MILNLGVLNIYTLQILQLLLKGLANNINITKWYNNSISRVFTWGFLKGLTLEEINS